MHHERSSVKNGLLFLLLSDGTDLASLLSCSSEGGRRMSSQHASTDGTDDYSVQQENELEALASIFGDDFQDLRKNDPWKVTRGFYNELD